MPISSSISQEKKNAYRLRSHIKSIDIGDSNKSNKHFLTIEPALPSTENKRVYKRSLSSCNLTLKSQESSINNPDIVQINSDGSSIVTRSEKQKEKDPNRICLDRRELTSIPLINGEPGLRLFSLQHNLISNLDGLKVQLLKYLVFLDLYDNQLERLNGLESVDNLRVLLVGKNRVKKIEGLHSLKYLEVLDLHGNKITNVTGLSSLEKLKVLNLAGNQIRTIGSIDLHGLLSLQELNLRRNKLKKLMGFGEVPNLLKLFLNNNEINSVEDICSLAKSVNIKEIAIDLNPICAGADCVPFLVSFLPHLTKVNELQVTEQIRKASMAWRRNKESTNTAFMDLTSDICLNIKREEVICNAKSNWEMLQSQTKNVNTKKSVVTKALKSIRPDSDFILTSLQPVENKCESKAKNKPFSSKRAPLLLDKKFNLVRAHSLDRDTSRNNSSNASNSSNEYIRLPPILVPIINKLEQDYDQSGIDEKKSDSLSSAGANCDTSAYLSESDGDLSKNDELEDDFLPKIDRDVQSEVEIKQIAEEILLNEAIKKIPNDVASNISCTSGSIVSIPSTSSNSDNIARRSKQIRSSKSAHNVRSSGRVLTRAVTAKPKKSSSPSTNKDREQGGDYLIEICGRYLNIFGQNSLRFIDKPWNSTRASDVTSVKFNYVNFNSIVGVLNKLKQRFINAEHFYFKETNIYCLGQINGLSELQGLCSLTIDPDGNPLTEKLWRSYAIYRLSHWGLKIINNVEVIEDEIREANMEYQSLSDLVLYSLPDAFLQPLLERLRIDISHESSEMTAKKWLKKADSALRAVVCKESLQWKKTITQEDLANRQKTKNQLGAALEETRNVVKKLRLLEQEWPRILHEIVRNALLDYSHLDMYMRKKLQELEKS